MKQRSPDDITILGGGPAGLALGYYAKKRGLGFNILEANQRVGGNCVTLRHGDFLFDTGAHRLHDRDPEITSELTALLGDSLKRTYARSQIYHQGRLVDFPISPLNLATSLGPSTVIKAVVELLMARVVRPRENGKSFASFATSTYGKTIAEILLLNYSEKLWGVPGHRLSTEVAGNRMNGLHLSALVKEVLLGKKAKPTHLDGAFYYPNAGIGLIMEKLGEFCGAETIRLGSRITRILHDDANVRAVEVNGRHRVDVSNVFCTLPLNRVVQMLDPCPPEELLDLSRQLRYRHLLLVTFSLDKSSVTNAATVYFPTPEIPFTRLYEPKNRSPHMSPPHQTSVVVEVPCQSEDAVWNMDRSDLVSMIRSQLIGLDLFDESEIIDCWVHRLENAYPVLELCAEEGRRRLVDYLGRLRNFELCGRNARFHYLHIHDLMRAGKEAIDDFCSLRPSDEHPPVSGSTRDARDDGAVLT